MRTHPTTMASRRRSHWSTASSTASTTVIEAGTIGHLEPAARAAREVGIRAGLGVWGWDIEHGPFTAPAAETLARQGETLDLLAGGDLVEGWVTLVGHDLASDELLAGAADLARSRGAHMTMHISPTSNDPPRTWRARACGRSCTSTASACSART